ncbi:MAG: glycosyltransferase [Chitinophagaceae bacterium]|nr:glycosyltransferase [Anaerolineae bacterium]
MKILIAHNTYQQRGGEDAVVDAEIALLRNYGNEVATYRRHNDELHTMSQAGAALSTVWSQRSSSQIEQICKNFKPDLIHVHNTFPLISPSLFWMASRSKIPIVQTLHNFRLLCVQAIFLRNGKVCEDCLGKLPWRAVVRKCYRDSALQSAVAVGMLGTHRMIGTYRERVTLYIALNAFCRDKYIQGGLPADRFRIKPNFVVSTELPLWKGRSGGLFVGRLSSEKGLDVLMDALKIRDTTHVEIIGKGQLECQAKAFFGERYLGNRSLDEILAKMGSAQFLVLPSICYENSPRTIVEAFSCGLPVIASRLGALVDIIQDGVTGILFNPGDASDLAEKIAWAESHTEEMLKMGQAARIEYEKKYTPERNYQMLADIYEEAIMAIQNENSHLCNQVSLGEALPIGRPQERAPEGVLNQEPMSNDH